MWIGCDDDDIYDSWHPLSAAAPLTPSPFSPVVDQDHDPWTDTEGSIHYWITITAFLMCVVVLHMLLWVTCAIRHRTVRHAGSHTVSAVCGAMTFVPGWTRAKVMHEQCSQSCWQRRLRYSRTSFRLHSAWIAGQSECTTVANMIRYQSPTWMCHTDQREQWAWGMHARIPIALSYSVQGADEPMYYARVKPGVRPVTLPPLPRNVYWDANNRILNKIEFMWWFETTTTTQASVPMVLKRIPAHLNSTIRRCFGPCGVHRERDSVHDWTGPDLNGYFNVATIMNTVESFTTSVPVLERNHVKRLTASLITRGDGRFLVLRGVDGTELILHMHV